ncbi:molybdopterin synthase sulfur carrier subunit [Candidatus Pantoea carbekii]|uniref:Molybdopterin synthase sulfur carrier subunit n=1 Tax=Candidatus Pantoea carbekii TaxID=1235990 RepID=U3U8L5_9GAMM|nr:molybdopterin synthase sulfur carrier subunit [Candidatus Pantoea carbekii]AKC32182.1 molybdopterin mpt converting factor subunit 1 [Candidatus Pantoea carbekii]BAO00709.1 hypothetical protein HHS_07390 [Candidatus Pantoea carbekii]
MIRVLFFSRVRELTGVSILDIALEYNNVIELRKALSQKSKNWAIALEASEVLVSVNQTLVPMCHPLQEGDEIAFFPPVTGG